MGVSIPSCVAASRIVEPSGTETGWPSILISIERRRGPAAPRESGREAEESLRWARRVADSRYRILDHGIRHENKFQRCKADSSALEAVWPRPQMEASRMA